MLILFDIDATLIKTSRACLHAMSDGFEHLFGRPCSLEGIQYAGCLDPVIFRNVLVKNNVETTNENLANFRDQYRQGLSQRLDVPGTGYLLPGAAELVSSLDAIDDLTLGLLTGNFEDTGRMKLERCGLDTSPFVVNAFGDESPHEPPLRRHLVDVALSRFKCAFGKKMDPAEVVVIGDSPHDVECAKSNGCRSLAVATGLHDANLLRSEGADLAVDSLADTRHLTTWITQR